MSTPSLPSAVPPPSAVPLTPGVPLPLNGPATSGFPSPADDYVEARIDLNLELIPCPLATFFMRVCGDAMRADGILDGDLVVIDRSVTARPGMVVVATHEGRFLVRRLQRRGSRLCLVAGDGTTPPLPLVLPSEADDPGDADFGPQLWGVVIHAVHHLAGARSRRR